ncbi:hypothetical protein C8R42DRAFT_637477 [Lentinula raphanica]|nr:hypothetical protein C8R42DRAFT_637477 [Lentinula raphanica]
MLHLAGLSYKITAAIRDNLNIWTTLQNWLLPLNGLAHLISLFSNSYFQDSAKLLILGSIVEAEYSITAEFAQGDPAYEWLSHFLNHEEVWRRACDFRVSSKNSSQKWGISAGKISELVEYVPTYLRPQLFRWRGYWVEISRVQEDSGGPFGHSSPGLHYPTVSTIIYTLDMSAMSAIIEEAHQRYLDVSKADVIVHGAMPKNSLRLKHGTSNEGFLIEEVTCFMDLRAVEKAGELGLEIYTLSLASNHIDDLYLQRAADSIPKNSIFVIEDIDCAMPSWDLLPPLLTPTQKPLENGILDRVTHETQMIQLSKTFASHIPSNEFSIADLQGYLLGYKDQPERAAVEFSAWAEQEREFKHQAEEKAARKKMKKEITEVKSSKP